MENLGGWLVTAFGFIIMLWAIYSVIESNKEKKEKHGWV